MGLSKPHTSSRHPTTFKSPDAAISPKSSSAMVTLEARWILMALTDLEIRMVDSSFRTSGVEELASRSLNGPISKASISSAFGLVNVVHELLNCVNTNTMYWVVVSMSLGNTETASLRARVTTSFLWVYILNLMEPPRPSIKARIRPLQLNLRQHLPNAQRSHRPRSTH